MKYIEFDREKIVDYYKEAAPDYDVRQIAVTSIDGSSLKYEWDIVFRKGDTTLTLAQAITDLDLPTPDDILNSTLR
ncbi:hypothetical protein [Flavobacterium sp. UBA4197]|uniref:hypothetical protein n=1 Tax=Flavobacterium sp. UBA4197 TaxID=1946546 RepID=UPI00257A596C|nr:hypothetical protein [Flavobacterium sp. UBA4197]